MVTSRWKLTLFPETTGTIIVDYGDMLGDDISPQASKLCGLAPVIRAAAPRIQDFQSTTVTIAISVRSVGGDSASYDRLAEFAGRDACPLRVEAMGASPASWHFFACSIQSLGTDTVPAADGFQWSHYSLTCAGLAYNPPVEAAAPDKNIPSQVQLDIENPGDGLAFWPKFGFVFPDSYGLTGNPSAGWVTSDGLARYTPQRSNDLASWSYGELVAYGTPVDNVDGTHTYWVRSIIPVYWEETMLDLVATTDRYGKSITAISVFGAAVSLSGFPYAMPADAARLQADLRTAGYAGATVTSVTGAMVVTAKNHVVEGMRLVNITQSGNNVTGVTYMGSAVSLPSFPYSMPSAKAALQADMRTAGLTGAVVMLHQDAWTVTLPDTLASGKLRSFEISIDPGDPFPYWDFYGVYQGLNAANVISGTAGNVRTPSGTPLLEADKQFARLKVESLA